MTPIRDREGRFLGVVEHEVSPELRHLELAVYPPRVRVLTRAVSVEPITYTSIHLERALWREDGRTSAIWLDRDNRQQELAHAHGVHVAGATCRTEYGKQMDVLEALGRLVLMLMPTCGTKH